MAGTNVQSSWMIRVDVFLHYALIFFTMETGMMFSRINEAVVNILVKKFKG